jgi:glycerophosphoryl diester phosphodiesterase
MKVVLQTWSDILAVLRKSWRELFVVHVIFTALGMILFSPLIAGMGRFLVGFSGRPALDDQDIVLFFLSPVGILAIIIILGLLVVVLAFEQAAMMRIAVGVKAGRDINVMHALMFSLLRVNRMFDFIIRLVARVLLMVTPFLLSAVAIAYWLLSEHDINYYLAQRPSQFWWAAMLMTLVLCGMFFFLIRKLIDWSLALPFLLFEDANPGSAFALSTRATSRDWSSIFWAVLVWLVLGLVLQTLLLLVLNILGSSLIPLVKGSLPVLVVLLGGLSLLWMLGNFLITTFTFGSFACLLAVFAEKQGIRIDASTEERVRPPIKFRHINFTPRTLVSGLLIVVVAATLAGVWLIEGIQPVDKVEIIAHRGAAGKAPENTIAAIRQAMEDGADWIELDVQQTIDGEVVVFHDRDFMKLAGNPIRVEEASLAELGAIDIGSWFDVSFAAERVPTLKQALGMAKNEAKILIELKYYGDAPDLAQRVVEIVEASDMVQNSAIMSLKYDALASVRTLRPDWPIGLVSARVIGDLTQLDSDFLVVEKGMARSGFIRRAHDAGKKVFVWTINDPVSMSRMMSLGVDGIITDEPAMGRYVLEKRKDMNIAERLLVHSTSLFGQSFTATEYRDDSP